MPSGNIVQVLVFLSMPHADLVRSVPLDNSRVSYAYIDEEGFSEGMTAPAKAAVVACLRIIEAYAWSPERDAAQEFLAIIKEIACVIEMMIGLSHTAGYQWLLDKNFYGIEGGYDVAWNILRRLSLVALDSLGSSIEAIETPKFETILAAGHITVIREGGVSE